MVLVGESTFEIMNNRTLKERDALNPDVALIRKTSSTNTNRAWQYLQLLIKKSNVKNNNLELWLTKRFAKLEEHNMLEMSDNRPKMAALFWTACVIHGVNVTVYDIREILKPLSSPAFQNSYKNMRNYFEN